MKDCTVLIALNFIGKPYIVEACETDYSKTRLSTHDWMKAEVEDLGEDDLLEGVWEAGVYEVTSVTDPHTREVEGVSFTRVPEIPYD